MNENEIKNKQIEEIKESVINKVRDLFGKAKDDLQIKRRLDILIQRDVPDILESNGIRNVDENVQDVLFESLEPVYNLNKNIDAMQVRLKAGVVSQRDLDNLLIMKEELLVGIKSLKANHTMMLMQYQKPHLLGLS